MNIILVIVFYTICAAVYRTLFEIFYDKCDIISDDEANIISRDDLANATTIMWPLAVATFAIYYAGKGFIALTKVPFYIYKKSLNK